MNPVLKGIKKTRLIYPRTEKKGMQTFRMTKHFPITGFMLKRHRNPPQHPSIPTKYCIFAPIIYLTQHDNFKRILFI